VPAACPECGVPTGPTRFCGNCGARLSAAASAERGVRLPPREDGTWAAPTPPRTVSADSAVVDPPPRAPRSRRIAAVGVLVAVVLLATVAQRATPRSVEPAGGLTSAGGATSPYRADPARVLWSRLVAIPGDPPVVTDLDASNGIAPLLTTQDAVWVLSGDRRAIQTELPRLAGAVVADADGAAAILAADGLTRVDLATARIVERREVPEVRISEPVWATPTSRGWAAADPRGGLVHVAGGRVPTSPNPADWRSSVQVTAPIIEIAGTLVVQTFSGLIGLDPADGSVRWEDPAEFVPGTTSPTAVLVGRRPQGDLVGLRAADGAELWAVAAEQVAFWLGLVDGEIVGIGPGLTTLVRIDPVNGEETGQVPLPPAGVAGVAGRYDPQLVGDLISTYDGRALTVFDVDGTVHGTLVEPGIINVVGDRDVVAVTGPRGTRVLDASLGDPYIASLPPRSLGADELRLPVSGRELAAAPGLFLDIDTGARVASRIADWTAAYGISGGFWLQDGGRTAVVDLGGEVRWRGPSAAVATPLADTAHGIVVVIDDGEIGETRLRRARDGVPVGPSLLDAGVRAGVPVTQDLVVSTRLDQAHDVSVTIGLEVSRTGLRERWRNEEVVGRALGDGSGRLVLVSPGRAVRLDQHDGTISGDIELDVLALDAVFVAGTLVLATDRLVVGLTGDGGRWELSLPHRRTAPLAVGGDAIHAGMEDGTVLTLDVGGVVVDELSVGGWPIRQLAVAGTTLLVRTDDRIIAYGSS